MNINRLASISSVMVALSCTSEDAALTDADLFRSCVRSDAILAMQVIADKDLPPSLQCAINNVDQWFPQSHYSLRHVADSDILAISKACLRVADITASKCARLTIGAPATLDERLAATIRECDVIEAIAESAMPSTISPNDECHDGGRCRTLYCFGAKDIPANSDTASVRCAVIVDYTISNPKDRFHTVQSIYENSVPNVCK